MRSLSLYFIDHYYNHRYRLFCKRVISDVQVYTYWRLKKPKVSSGIVRIPMYLHRPNIQDQSILINNFLREAIAIRIKKKIRKYGKESKN